VWWVLWIFEGSGEPLPGAVQPDIERCSGAAEYRGGLLGIEAIPRDQCDRIAIVRRQPRERSEHLWMIRLPLLGDRLTTGAARPQTSGQSLPATR